MVHNIVRQSVVLFFVFSLIVPPNLHAQTLALPSRLPAPGTMLELSKPYMPVTVKGLRVNPQEPFQFDFLIDSGDTGLKDEALKAEAKKLMKYFLAALTIPENEAWVNLSPYEKDRMITKSFGDTEMGRDLLAQDYVLKQLTASLTYPEKEMGRKFWDKVYAEAGSKFGNSKVPVNTFNKVWIMPAKARVYEHNNGAFVVESRLKVMLEEDYLSLSKQKAPGNTHAEASQIVREVIIPALEREVNEGEHFATLRQIYQAMVLATWYKIRLKDSILGRSYVDQDKTKGVHVEDAQANEKIYQQYLAAFKKGAYNYIKEDYDPSSEKAVARKYISGGATALGMKKQVEASLAAAPSAAEIARAQAVRGDEAMMSWAARSISPSRDKAMSSIPSIKLDLPKAQRFVDDETELMKPDNVIVVDAGNMEAIFQHALDAGLIFEGDNGNYGSYSHPEDTARSVPMTFMSSRNKRDKGLLNNWIDSKEVLEELMPHVKGSMQGKTMYVIPYVAGPADKPIGRPGIQVTDSLAVVLQYLKLYNDHEIGIGQVALDLIKQRGGDFLKISHSTGDLNSIKRTNQRPTDIRRFVMFTNQQATGSGDIVDQYGINIVRLFGSEYGGNGIGAKKFASLRLALLLSILGKDSSTSHMFMNVLEDKETHETFGIAGAFPSYSGKTNAALVQLAPHLADRYNVWMVSDDLVEWKFVPEPDGKGGTRHVKRGHNPEHGAFMVAPGINSRELGRAMQAIGQGGAFSVNLGYQFRIDPKTGRRIIAQQWWEKHDRPLSHLTLEVAAEYAAAKDGKLDAKAGWFDWKGKAVRDRLKDADADDIRAVAKFKNVLERQLDQRPKRQRNKLYQPLRVYGANPQQVRAVRRGLKAIWEAMSGKDKELAHPNGRITVSMDKVDNWIGHADKLPEGERPQGWDHPNGQKVDVELYGGRRSTTQPLVVVMKDPMQGLYDGFFMKAESTAAEEGSTGLDDYDPYALRPFMPLPEGVVAQHFIDRVELLGSNAPMTGHVNWFKRLRQPDGKLGGFMWPGFQENSRVFVWLKDLKEGNIPDNEYRLTPIGIIPTENASFFYGLNLSLEERRQLTEFNLEEWKIEVEARTRFAVEKLKMDVPDPIRREHEKLAAALGVALPPEWTNAPAWREMQRQKAESDQAQTARSLDEFLKRRAALLEALKTASGEQKHRIREELGYVERDMAKFNEARGSGLGRTRTIQTEIDEESAAHTGSVSFDKAQAPDVNGGIDLNRKNLGLQIDKDKAMAVPVPLSNGGAVNIGEGLYPEILNVVSPVPNLPMILGLNPNAAPQDPQAPPQLTKADKLYYLRQELLETV